MTRANDGGIIGVFVLIAVVGLAWSPVMAQQPAAPAAPAAVPAAVVPAAPATGATGAPGTPVGAAGAAGTHLAPPAKPHLESVEETAIKAKNLANTAAGLGDKL